MTAREQVIRSLTASIEGACERVLAPGSAPGSRYYPTAQRERDAAFAAEMLRVLVTVRVTDDGYVPTLPLTRIAALQERVNCASADVGAEVER